MLVRDEPTFDGAEYLGLAAHRGQQGGEFTQRCQPALADHPLGVLGDDAQHAADRPRIVRRAGCRRRCGRSPRDSHCRSRNSSRPSSQVALPVRITVSVRGRDVAPDLRPYLGRRPPQCPGMLGAQGHRGIGVVVEECQVRAPAEPHRIARRDQDAQRPSAGSAASYAARPTGWPTSRANRSARPFPPRCHESRSGRRRFFLPIAH